MSRRPGSIAGYESAWNKKVSWCCQQQIDPVCSPLWKRPTISNYKITPLFYFIVPQICRWKASWGTSQSLCLAERFLQSKATTASLNIYLRCWISFALFEDNMSVNSQLSNSNKDLTHKLTIWLRCNMHLGSHHYNTEISTLWQEMTRLINFIFINRTKVGGRVKLYQQSNIRHTYKFLTFVLLRHYLNIFFAQKVGGWHSCSETENKCTESWKYASQT